MPAYFDHFMFKSLTTYEFKEFLYNWFITNRGEELKAKLDEIDWDAWFYGRGMPPVTPKFDLTLATPAYDLAKAWAKAASDDADPDDLTFKKDDLKDWFAGQICSLSIN
jgi:leukotriene-A4 hydrolase